MHVYPCAHRIKGALLQWVSQSVPNYCALVPAAEHFKGMNEFLWDETKLEDVLLEGTWCVPAPRGHSIRDNRQMLAWSLQTQHCGSSGPSVPLSGCTFSRALCSSTDLAGEGQVLGFLDLLVTVGFLLLVEGSVVCLRFNFLWGTFCSRDPNACLPFEKSLRSSLCEWVSPGIRAMCTEWWSLDLTV